MGVACCETLEVLVQQLRTLALRGCRVTRLDDTDGTRCSIPRLAPVRTHLAFVPVHRLGSESGQADGHVGGPAGLRGGVPDPLTAAHEHGLAGAHVERPALVLDVQAAVEDERPLVELRALPGLDPAGRRGHPREAQALLAGVDAADELLDHLGHRPRRLDGRRARDQLWHRPDATRRRASTAPTASP